MSGMEVVGLLLGVFPLIISAMEHYEDVKKPTMIWWKIRRAHKRDYGKVKDCQFAFSHQLEMLLYPLLDEEIVDRRQYERLLEDAGGQGWQETEISMALQDRLGERQERYIEVLSELQEAMEKLCKATKVDDPQFQKLLEDRKDVMRGIVPQSTQQQVSPTLVMKANVKFQAKRLKYSLTELNRDELLNEVEDYIGRLRQLLMASDELSALPRRSKRTHKRPVSKKVLEFWMHADTIYQLIRDAWHCNCRSRACVWLQQNYAKVGELRIRLLFCHGGHSAVIKLSERPPTIRINSARRGAGQAARVAGPTTQQITSLQISQHSAVQSAVSLTTLLATSQTSITTSVPAGQSSTPQPDEQANLNAKDLCKTFSCTNPHDGCVETLCRDEKEYEVYPHIEDISTTTRRTLAEVLQAKPGVKLGRVHRYGIALTLASSHLQLHRSPWLTQPWTCEDVLFPTSPGENNRKVLYGQPYILSTFNSQVPHTQAQKDRSFSTLGIVLLELCFGIRLEAHPLWENPLYASGRGDAMFRQAVACEWLDDVEEEAGEDFAMAVNWTLKQAPAVIKDDRWRADFAENVVQPLQRCYESMRSEKVGA